MASDLRALPDRTLSMFLYPIGAWAVLFAALFFGGLAQWAIPLCYPLALWQTALSAIWGLGLLRRLDAGELTLAEAHAGVRSVGQILAGSGMTPAIVFLTQDPLASDAWRTTGGAVLLGILAYGGIWALTQLPSRWTHGAALALGCVVLPLNATGAVTLATMAGWFGALTP